MQRDMDLIRELVLGIAESPRKPSWKDLTEGKTNEETEKALYHIGLLDEAGFIKGMKTSMQGWVLWQDLDLTWEGHDFADSVKDPDIWAKTKKGATAAAGGFTVDLLKDLAKGLIKKQIEEYTGVKL